MAYQNNGDQSWKVLEQFYTDDKSLTGIKMPNIQNISPQAIVPESAVITYNYPTDVAPSGGANGDIWYNPIADQLFKKKSGSWQLLTDRVNNINYVAPIKNTDACPVPQPTSA